MNKEHTEHSDATWQKTRKIDKSKLEPAAKKLEALRGQLAQMTFDLFGTVPGSNTKTVKPFTDGHHLSELYNEFQEDETKMRAKMNKIVEAIRYQIADMTQREREAKK